MNSTTIHKYKLPLRSGTIPLPIHPGTILDCQLQHDAICIWALVDLSKPTIKRFFTIVATGSPLSTQFIQDHKYIKTVQQGHNLSYVWHVFETIILKPGEQDAS